jgi:hypothetical protein
VRTEGEQQRVTVGGRARRLSGADVAARARDVLDIELPAEMLAKFLRGEPCEDVGRAAGRERHDDAHRARGIGLRAHDAREGR